MAIRHLALLGFEGIFWRCKEGNRGELVDFILFIYLFFSPPVLCDAVGFITDVVVVVLVSQSVMEIL